MLYAWYGHLRSMSNAPVWLVIVVSWLIALAEYCVMIPANKIGAKFSMVLGDDEIANGTAKLKNMDGGEQTEIPLEDEKFVREFTAAKLAEEFKE